MYAAAGIFHSLLQRILEFAQRFFQLLLCQQGVDRTRLQQSAGEDVTDAVVDVTGDPVAFIQRGDLDLIFLFSQQRTVLFLQQTVVFDQQIPLLMGLLCHDLMSGCRFLQPAADEHPECDHEKERLFLFDDAIQTADARKQTQPAIRPLQMEGPKREITGEDRKKWNRAQ